MVEQEKIDQLRERLRNAPGIFNAQFAKPIGDALDVMEMMLKRIKELESEIDGVGHGAD